MKKERTYDSFDRPFFCPSCHHRVLNPLAGANFKGTLNLNCGHCGKGKVIVKAKPDLIEEGKVMKEAEIKSEK